ncbi:hypothetical protein BC834DRAFT_975040 [Gloeopeniophorella convolvens]|nr:hypothetical protein BC834DRAFT_975040 [Gloeopeniophorella convolvens]
MAHSKDKHYWTQLRIATTGGAWGAPYPAKAFNNTPISWSELLRKFNKHCHGFSEVAEVTSQTQALSLLVAVGTTDSELDSDRRPGEEPLALGTECLVAEEHADEALTGFDVLKKLELEHTNSDSLKLTLAYYSYALGNPDMCLSYLAQVRDLANVQGRPGAVDSLRSNTTTLQAPSVSDNTSSGSFIGSFVSSDSAASIADISDGKAWAATEAVRSVCLQGMSHEKLMPADVPKALTIYLAVAQKLPALENEISRNFPPNPIHATSTGPGHITLMSFMRYRELWRWVERLLRRAIILASRSRASDSEQECTLWALFSQYQACSEHWPPTFRAEHRSTISVLYIRALVLRARHAGRHSQPSDARFHPGTTDGLPTFLTLARRAIKDYRDVLNACSHFPKAGERNFKIEELTDLCVAVWETGGSKSGDAAWVVDVLWWATRLTFNAPRVFRHMMRIAEANGDPTLAVRALRLYVQIVGKAKLAGDTLEPDPIWVATLVWGARMLCRLSLLAGPISGHHGIHEAREAGLILDKAKYACGSVDSDLKSRVALAEGIWNTVMAIKEQDHLSRTSRLTSALSLFESSIRDLPSPSGYFHIALALYRPTPGRHIDRAIENARMAVELEPDNIRYWHLLGMLLAASEDWRGAREVLEIGAALDDRAWALDQSPLVAENNLDGNSVSRQTDPTTGVVSVDHAFGPASETSPTSEDASTLTILPQDPIAILDARSNVLPSAEELLQPLPDHPAPSSLERFEHSLQLRMTQLALTELMEGPEGAEEKWIEVFQWFAKRQGTEKDSRRTSIDTGRRSLETDSDGYAPHGAPSLQDDTNVVYTPRPVQVTITPPTPAQDESTTIRNGTPRASVEETEKEKEKDKSAGKKVQKMLKNRVHKEQRRISTIGRKIGHGVGRHSGGLNLRRTTSTPVDLLKAMGLDHTSYQASSIHSRRHSPYASTNELVRPESPPPMPPSAVPAREKGERSRRELRLLSDLWLMSAATFRRSGKIEQARGAIQEAEVRDEENPNVWVQLGLYYTTVRNSDRAVQAFSKALFISPDSVPATIHLSQSYLSMAKEGSSEMDNVDLVAGMLSDLTQGSGWDVPEAWYFLGKAHGIRDMRDRERECLNFALSLAESRPLRDIGEAIGWCL